MHPTYFVRQNGGDVDYHFDNSFLFSLFFDSTKMTSYFWIPKTVTLAILTMVSKYHEDL
jgi:hypothetical protein